MSLLLMFMPFAFPKPQFIICTAMNEAAWQIVYKYRKYEKNIQILPVIKLKKSLNILKKSNIYLLVGRSIAHVLQILHFYSMFSVFKISINLNFICFFISYFALLCKCTIDYKNSIYLNKRVDFSSFYHLYWIYSGIFEFILWSMLSPKCIHLVLLIYLFASIVLIDVRLISVNDIINGDNVFTVILYLYYDYIPYIEILLYIKYIALFWHDKLTYIHLEQVILKKMHKELPILKNSKELQRCDKNQFRILENYIFIKIIIARTKELLDKKALSINTIYCTFEKKNASTLTGFGFNYKLFVQQLSKKQVDTIKKIIEQKEYSFNENSITKDNINILYIIYIIYTLDINKSYAIYEGNIYYNPQHNHSQSLDTLDCYSYRNPGHFEWLDNKFATDLKGAFDRMREDPELIQNKLGDAIQKLETGDKNEILKILQSAEFAPSPFLNEEVFEALLHSSSVDKWHGWIDHLDRFCYY